jgi:two-component system, NarL family, invasion response regulator UvrY
VAIPIVPIKVLLADEAELMRRAIRFVLGQREGIKVVGEASSLEAAIQKATELGPHVVVLDLNMANRDHTPLTEVRSLLKGAKILGITFGCEGNTAELAYRIGAAKVLDKMDMMDELIPSILELGSNVV